MRRPDFPKTPREFQARFTDEVACRPYLAESRWPDGYGRPWVAGEKQGFCPGPVLSLLNRGTLSGSLQIYFLALIRPWQENIK